MCVCVFLVVVVVEPKSRFSLCDARWLGAIFVPPSHVDSEKPRASNQISKLATMLAFCNGSRLPTMYVRTCLGTFQYFDRLNGKFVEDTRIFVSYLGLLRKPVDWTIYFHAPYSTCICVKANNRLAQPAIPVPSERPIVQQTPKKKKATHQANSYQSAALLFWGGALSLSLSLSHLSSNKATKLALEITNK